MPTFTPPVANVIPPVLPETRGPQRRLFRHYGPWPRGQSVVFRNGNYVTVPNPSDEELRLLIDGVTYFLGGHVYVVSTDIAGLLIADGYSPVDDWVLTESGATLVTESGDTLVLEVA